MKDARWIEHQMDLLAIKLGDPGYEKMLDAAKRGWPAWRLAQAYGFPDDTIHRLGGPPPRTHT